jgi:hypothetical protein
VRFDLNPSVFKEILNWLKMKTFVVLFALFVAVFAEDHVIDWSSVRPAREFAKFWKNQPAVLAVNGQSSAQIRNRARIVNGQIAE